MHFELQLFWKIIVIFRERELSHPECLSSKILGPFRHEMCLDYLHMCLDYLHMCLDYLHMSRLFTHVSTLFTYVHSTLNHSRQLRAGGSRVLLPAEARGFSVLRNIHNGPEATQLPIQQVAVFFPGGKTTGACSWITHLYLVPRMIIVFFFLRESKRWQSQVRKPSRQCWSTQYLLFILQVIPSMTTTQIFFIETSDIFG